MVVDLPRSADPVAAEIADRCDQVLVVVVPTVAGVAAAVRICARRPDPTTVRLVLRGSGIDARAVERATGIPVLAQMSDQRGIAESIDLGLGPVRSPGSALGRAARAVLDRVSLAPGRVAA